MWLFDLFKRKKKGRKKRTKSSSDKLKFFESIDTELANAYCKNDTRLIPQAMSPEAKQYTRQFMQGTYDRAGGHSKRYPNPGDMIREVNEVSEDVIIREVSCKKYRTSGFDIGYVNPFSEEFTISGDNDSSFNVEKIRNIKE